MKIFRTNPAIRNASTSFVCAALLSVLVASCGHSVGDVLLAGEPPALATRTLVVAELFTSEGCSSCPPADDLLRQLAQQPSSANVEVLGLEEHVDYWDRLGWRDPFSSAAFTNRQSAYAEQTFRSGSIYTPQLVVDGRFQEIGSDRAAVGRAITNAARLPKAVVIVESALPADAHVAHLSITVDRPPAIGDEVADVMVAIVEDGLTTDVLRGENHGRTLKHGAITRLLAAVGVLGQDHTWTGTVSIPLAPAWKVSNLRVISFAQQRHSRHIIGAGATRVDPR